MRHVSHFLFALIYIGERMDIYIDLSLINYFLNSIISLFLIKNLSLKNIKFYYFIILSVINCLQLTFIYQNFYICLTLYLLLNLLIFIKLFKKECVLYLILYLLFSYISQFLIMFSFDGLVYYKGIFIISKSVQALSLLCYPIILIIIFIISIFVDKLYRFRNYKEKVFLIINDKKYVFNGYMDSGNTLMHDNTPVIFINKNMNLNFDEEIFVNTLTGNNVLKGKKCLISINGKSSYTYAYLCSSNENDFNGCECLLNIYLT